MLIWFNWRELYIWCAIVTTLNIVNNLVLLKDLHLFLTWPDYSVKWKSSSVLWMSSMALENHFSISTHMHAYIHMFSVNVIHYKNMYICLRVSNDVIMNFCTKQIVNKQICKIFLEYLRGSNNHFCVAKLKITFNDA